ncbi:hypothetical protein EDD17DRAFT_1511765 [Pisolithus thermaeus]|nr:hypothetical protein EDD17DRAFT_1511765 [Pisolithus thermaeus]
MDDPPQQTLASGRPKRRAANVHPGRIVLDNQPKRQTSAQKEADSERAREALAMKVAAMKKGYQRVSDIEDRMGVEQSSAIPSDKPVKPRPRLRTVARNPSQTGDHGGMSEPLTPLADVEDSADEGITSRVRKEKMAKPRALREAIISTRKNASSPSTRDNNSDTASLSNMFLLTEATLFFTNVLTTASADDKASLCKRVKTWVNIVDARSARTSSVSGSLRSSTAPPPSSSTVATSTTGIEASTPHFDPQSLVDDPNDPCMQFESQLPEDWKWPSHQQSIPENEDGETDQPVGPVVVDLQTLENAQCAAAMSKDCEVDNAVTGPANRKGPVKSSVSVTKTVPKKIKTEASESLSTLTTTSASKVSRVASDSSNQMDAASAQARFNSADLPSGLHKDQKWRREVVPTLILWAGNQDDAFNITKQDICHALREIISVVYPTLKNVSSTILPNSPMVAVATVAQLAAFFLNPHDPSPKVTAQVLLDHFTFLYEDLDATSPEKAFRSVFVQQLLLGSHLSATKGFVQVSALDTSSLAKHGIVGALGLCGAALMRGLNLIKSGDIELKAPANTKDGIAKLATRDVRTPVRFNMASGKDSKTACAFSDQNWGTPTRKFTSAAQRRSITQLQDIVELALTSLTIGQEPDPNALSNAGSDDEFALICMISNVSPRLLPSQNIYISVSTRSRTIHLPATYHSGFADVLARPHQVIGFVAKSSLGRTMCPIITLSGKRFANKSNLKVPGVYKKWMPTCSGSVHCHCKIFGTNFGVEVAGHAEINGGFIAWFVLQGFWHCDWLVMVPSYLTYELKNYSASPAVSLCPPPNA